MSEIDEMVLKVNDHLIIPNEKSDGRATECLNKTKIALVYGTIPSHEELEQYTHYSENCDFTLITAESISRYVQDVCFFEGLNILPLSDHEENHSFLPGLERALSGFDVVIVKERVGLYAYQAVKSKWINNFRLYVIIDNVTPFPGEDIRQMKTVREEVTSAADGLIVQSKLVQNMLVTVEGISKDRIFYLNPFVNCRRINSISEKTRALKSLNFHDGDYLVVAIGQLEWEEGLLDIIHAIKHIHEKEGEYCKVKLAISGVGSFDNDILERCRTLGIDHAIVMVEPSREATRCLLTAADLIFTSSVQSRDRLEGDPFRILLGVANGIPVLSGRTPIVEEFIGKHRIDFCVGSPRSISNAILRARNAYALVSNIRSKNLNNVNIKYNDQISKEDFFTILSHSENHIESDSNLKSYRQVKEVEKLVVNKQYIDAIALVERLFGDRDLRVHHRANLYRLIGDCFAKLNDKDSAKESYTHALELDPYLSKAFLGLGAIKLADKNFNGSIIDFQKAISYAPQDDMANLGLGMCFHGIGELKEARSWILSALKYKPTNEMALFSLVRLSNQADDYAGCELSLRAFLNKQPNHPDMLFTLAGIFYKQGKFNDAKVQIEKILKFDPTHKRALDLYDLTRKKIKKLDLSSQEKTKVG